MLAEGELALEVIALSDHEWRVCDAGLDAADGTRVLGYVERQDDGFELLRMAPIPGVSDHFDRFADALTALSGRRG